MRCVPGSGYVLIEWPGLDAARRHGSSSRQCLLAFASVVFGRIHGVSEVVASGRRLYVTALRDLNKRLTAPSPRVQRNQSNTHRSSGSNLNDDALLSAMILGSYEFFTLTSATGWASHYKGLGQMMRLRGPEAHVEELPRRMLESNRFMIVVAALAERTRTFLSEPAWKSVPWSKFPKSWMQRLLDHVVDIPDLQVEVNELDLANTDNSPDSDDHDIKRLALHDRALDILDGLLSWRSAWDTFSGSAPTSIPSPTSASVVQARLFPTILTFISLEAANCVCTFDGACILLYELLAKLAPDMLHDDVDFPDAMGGQGLYVNDAREAAMEICRSIPYQMASDRGMAGPLFVLFPLRLAWRALGENASEEGRWLMGLLREIAEGNGWGIGRSEMITADRPEDMFREGR